MVRIATTSMESFHASEHYRIHTPLEALCKYNGWRFKRYTDQEIADGKLKGNDIFFFWNPSHPKSLAYIKAAQQAGCKVWIDFDDNWDAVPLYHPHSWRTNPAYQKELNIKLVKEADAVSVTTDCLWMLANRYNDNSYLIPNALPNKIQNEWREKENIIGWRGSDRHIEDVREGSKGLINDDRLQYHFVGFSPWFLIDKKIPYAYTTWSRSLQEYFNNLMTINMKWCWVPMINNLFNASVSNIAWLESASVGAVTIAPTWLKEFDVAPALRYKNHKELKRILNEIAEGNLDDAWNRYQKESVKVINEDYVLSKTNEIRKNLVFSLVDA
jgi:hypothetical protein